MFGKLIKYGTGLVVKRSSIFLKPLMIAPHLGIPMKVTLPFSVEETK